MNETAEKDWSSTEESDKAWMSVRDADLLEQLLLRWYRLHQKKLNVIEWGGGRSTCWYTQLLDHLEIPYCWLMLEYNREFFNNEVKNKIISRNNSVIFYSENIPHDFTNFYENHTGPISIVYNHGCLAPFDTGNKEERLVNMDEYVSFPAQYNLAADIIVVDGRKRRRCTFEGQKLIKNKGVVVLHDAWRKHYQCAWDKFESHKPSDTSILSQS